jgi:hypothetical protein
LSEAGRSYEQEIDNRICAILCDYGRVADQLTRQGDRSDVSESLLGFFWGPAGRESRSFISRPCRRRRCSPATARVCGGWKEKIDQSTPRQTMVSGPDRSIQGVDWSNAAPCRGLVLLAQERSSLDLLCSHSQRRHAYIHTTNQPIHTPRTAQPHRGDAAAPTRGPLGISQGPYWWLNGA